MGSGLKKNQIDMGKSPADEKSWEAYRWCIKNRIYISPLAKSNTEWYIVIENNGKINKSPDTYGKNIIWPKVFEFYKYYYDKYRK